jgi:hypothetical protein
LYLRYKIIKVFVILDFLLQKIKEKGKFYLFQIELEGFIGFVEELKRNEEKRTNLLIEKEKKWDELKLQNNEIQELEFKILKDKEISSETKKLKTKNQELMNKQAKLLAEKKNLLEEQISNVSEDENKGRELEKEDTPTSTDLLEHFFRKAKYLLEQKKKIQLLQNKKSDSKFNEMQIELREINMELAKRKEEIDRQIGEELEFTNEMINNELEQEKKGKEEDFNMTKKILERKINALQIENYSISSKVRIKFFFKQFTYYYNVYFLI